MIADPDRRIDSLPLLTSQERRQILVEWNDTGAPAPQGVCIHHLIESQTARRPDAIAVACRDRSMTYNELNTQASRIARRLIALDVGPENVVGICVERSAPVIVALLGVLKAGAAYLPLDPSYPAHWLAHVLAEAKPKALLTTAELAARLPVDGGRVICLDALCEAEDDNTTCNPAVSVTEDNLAYVIYTSGSTGEPKGVLVTHGNLVHSTTARWQYYRDPVEGFLLLSPFAFDSSVAGIFWTLTQGGKLVLPADEQMVDITALCGLVASQQVSHLLCIPALYGAMLEQEHAVGRTR